jgi:hypothetical protein
VRLFRLLGLLAVVAAAYFAGYLLQQRSLSRFFPSWLLIQAPALYAFARWLPADLMTLAFWLSGAAALGFGLLAPPWSLAERRQLTARTAIRPGRRRIALFFRLLGVLAVASASIYLFVSGPDDWPVQMVWAGGLFLYLLGAIVVATPRHPPLEDAARRPSRSHWLFFLLLLGGSGLLLLWGWRSAPFALDRTLAVWGIQAQRLSQQAGSALFTVTDSTSPSTSPMLASAWALAIWLGGDPLLSLRAIGLVSGLLAVSALWLLGGELFRRPLRLGPYEEVIEDEGRSLALLAAALFATSPLLLHFGQLPVFLEPVTWGLLGLWALLCGLRSGDRLATSMSGILCGLAALLYPSGLVFPLVALCWWVGVWLLQPGWLHPPAAKGRRRLLSLYWLGGLFVTIAPQVAAWVKAPDGFLARWVGGPLPGLSEFLALLNLDVYRGSLLNYPAHGLSNVIAPLLILVVGNLLLNLDRLVGWALFTWIIVAVVIGSLLAPEPHFWPALLPLVPALALALAFTLDRLRIALLETVGASLTQATTYLLIGLVVWLGLLGWLDYRQFVQMSVNPAVQTALALREVGPEQAAVLVLGVHREEVNWESPVIQLLAPAFRHPTLRLSLTPGDWSTTLPAQSTVLMLPEDRGLLSDLQTRYPGGRIYIRRDERANPVLYGYQIP